MVKVDSFPTVVMYRPRDLTLWPRHNLITGMALKCCGASVQSVPRICCIKCCGLKAGGGFCFHSRRVAELDLTPPIGQFLGDHFVSAGPAIVKAIRLAVGICGTFAGHD